MSKRPGDPGYSATWCIYFRDMSRNDTCEVGVNYASLNGGDLKGSINKLPCFIKSGGHERLHCDHFRPPTAEEIKAHEQWLDGRLKRLRKVMVSIQPWREKHKGQSCAEVVECPICSGRLHLSIAAYNGHVHGKCETDGCVSWME